MKRRRETDIESLTPCFWVVFGVFSLALLDFIFHTSLVAEHYFFYLLSARGLDIKMKSETPCCYW